MRLTELNAIHNTKITINI